MFSATWKGRSFDLGKMNLNDLVKAYFTYYAIQVYLVLAAASIIVAFVLGAGWFGPLVAGVAIVVLYPVVWYLLHRFVLHSKFLYRWKSTAVVWKRIHFDHHQDPHSLNVLFGALYTTLPTIVVVTLPVGWLIAGPAGAAAALAAGLLTTCAYEFVHCIQHLNFKPQNKWLKHMKEHHLLHHFHHEDGNYGITSFAVDKALGTYYDKAKDRPRSPTVYNLGYDVEKAKQYPWVAEETGHMPRDRPPQAARQQA
ncbi:sterol desaturase family protein [Octadecabacter sp.]|nr:sterol desaturase family protein [Octadecabacter sp.]